MAQIKTDNQLKAKLTHYNYNYSQNEFDFLKKYGFYHVFNSIEQKSIRNNNVQKDISNTILIFNSDIEIRSILFPVIMEIEGFLKQRYNDVIVDELISQSTLDPHYNYFVQYCIKQNKNIDAKKILFQCSNHSNKIVSHHFNKHKDIPIWGYIELLSFGNFKKIFTYSTHDVFIKFDKKCKFVNSVGSQFSYVHNNSILEYFFDPLYEIRNNLAHNQPIIDIRFKKQEYKNTVLSKFIYDLLDNYANRIGSSHRANRNITYNFSCITDYLILIYLLYVNLNESNSLSIRVIEYLNNKILNNDVNLHTKIHSKIYGKDNRIKVLEIINL